MSIIPTVWNLSPSYNEEIHKRLTMLTKKITTSTEKTTITTASTKITIMTSKMLNHALHASDEHAKNNLSSFFLPFILFF